MKPYARASEVTICKPTFPELNVIPRPHESRWRCPNLRRVAVGAVPVTSRPRKFPDRVRRSGAKKFRGVRRSGWLSCEGDYAMRSAAYHGSAGLFWRQSHKTHIAYYSSDGVGLVGVCAAV